jgi:hypothetical protein
MKPQRGSTAEGEAFLVVLNERRDEHTNSADASQGTADESFRTPKAEGINLPAFLGIHGGFLR